MPSADETLSRHGRRARAPNSSARAGFSVSTVRRSIMSVRDSNFFQKAESKFRILGGVKPFRTRGRKARREGGGNQDNPRDEQPIRSVLEHDEQFGRVPPNTTRTLTECPGSHTNAFLLSAKGSENDKGGIFRVAPFVNPKTPHTPSNEKRARGEQPPPCLMGQMGNVNKRTNEMGTSARQRTKSSCAIKARGGRLLRACFDFNLTSLSRARKF